MAVLVATVIIASLVDNKHRKGLFVPLYMYTERDILLRSSPVFATSGTFFQKCSL
jgi:hypothetical protein